MSVSTLMSKKIITLSPQNSLRDARELMQLHDFRHIVVIEEGELVGIVSDRDVLARSTRTAAGLDVPLIPLAEVMTVDPLTCGPLASIAFAARSMVEAKVSALPVVDASGALVGIVTATDLMNSLWRRASSGGAEKAKEVRPRSQWERTPISYLT